MRPYLLKMSNLIYSLKRNMINSILEVQALKLRDLLPSKIT